MREPPERIQRLPEQYFTALLARVSAAAAEEGEQFVDLGRGNPEVGPPEHVVRALVESAARPDVHGYSPFAGLPELKEALAGAIHASFDGFDTAADALYLNFPSNPTAATDPDGLFEEAVRWAERNGAWIMHDFAYGDLVFDGRKPTSFLATDGARDVGLELFSMSKTYGMAGWRLGFAVGNAELVRRIETLQDHAFAGIFRPVQEEGIAALSGPQDSVEARRAAYERRRDRALAALDGLEAKSEGTFFVWLRLPESLTAEQLLVERRVALAPGEGFGKRGAGWARLSLAVADQTLDLGLERLRSSLFHLK